MKAQMLNYGCVSVFAGREGGVGVLHRRLHSPDHNVWLILCVDQIAQSTDGQQNKQDRCRSWDMIEVHIAARVLKMAPRGQMLGGGGMQR